MNSFEETGVGGNTLSYLSWNAEIVLSLMFLFTHGLYCKMTVSTVDFSEWYNKGGQKENRYKNSSGCQNVTNYNCPFSQLQLDSNVMLVRLRRSPMGLCVHKAQIPA